MLRSAPLPTPLMSTSSLESVEEADARMWRDKAFARFKSEAEAVLLHFERAQEWADLIADLLKLQRVLNKYPQFNVVPDKVLVAKRLYQCLNSALPAGVHLKTLETFELIFSRIGVERLARDLAFYSEGIFPLYRYAAFQVKPVLLDLFERHYVPLGPRVVPCLPGLVPALLLAMDDVGADRLSQRALSLLDALASCTPIAAFMAAVWGCLLHNSAVRLQALHYITTRFPTPGADADDGSGGLGETSKGVATTSSARLAVPPELFCPDAEGTVLRSLVVALQRGFEDSRLVFTRRLNDLVFQSIVVLTLLPPKRRVHFLDFSYEHATIKNGTVTVGGFESGYNDPKGHAKASAFKRRYQKGIVKVCEDVETSDVLQDCIFRIG